MNLTGKQDVQKYQQSLITNSQINKQQSYLTYNPFSFQQWKLPQIIRELQDNDYEQKNGQSSIRKLLWIGNHKYSSILAYFYTVLLQCQLCEKMFTSFKQIIYKYSQFYLSLSQQKMLVQFIAAINQTNSVSSLIQQNKFIQEIFVKLFEAIYRNKKVSTIKQLANFSKEIFQLVNVHYRNNNVLQIKSSQVGGNNSQPKPLDTYIITDKQCYFIYFQGKSQVSIDSERQNFYINSQHDLQNRKKQQIKMPKFLLKKANGVGNQTQNGNSQHADIDRVRKDTMKFKKRLQLQQKRKNLIENLKNAGICNKSACNIKNIENKNKGNNSSLEIRDIKNIIRDDKSVSKDTKTKKRRCSQQKIQAQQFGQSPKPSPRAVAIKKQSFELEKGDDHMHRKSDLLCVRKHNKGVSSIEMNQKQQVIKSIQKMRKSTTSYVKKLNQKTQTSKNESFTKNAAQNDQNKKFTKPRDASPIKSNILPQEKKIPQTTRNEPN